MNFKVVEISFGGVTVRGVSKISNPQFFRVPNLVAPYCATPRDYLSDILPLHAMGCWCLNMANWVRYPLPLFWAFPPWRACEVEVQPPPRMERVSQRHLRDTTCKQGKWVPYPPVDTNLENVLPTGGGGDWAANVNAVVLNAVGHRNTNVSGTQSTVARVRLQPVLLS